MIHYVYKRDLEVIQAALLELGENIRVTANYITQQLYASLKERAAEVVRVPAETSSVLLLPTVISAPSIVPPSISGVFISGLVRVLFVKVFVVAEK